MLTGLECLLTGLQQHPPPIEYPARRQVGDDPDLITDAVRVGRLRHPSPVPLETLVGQFSERFTGGDIAYAPESNRLGPTTPANGASRRRHGVASCDLFHVAHQRLKQAARITGPLSWRPGLLPLIAPASTPAVG